MALANDPKLLIADEPTTALDVTVQAQILDLIQRLQSELDTAIVMITHDLGVVAEVADEIAVMYAGEIVEHASTDTIFAAPEHPYTWGLLRSIPRLDLPSGEELVPIRGPPPSLITLPGGCSFHPRCPYVREAHRHTHPALDPVPDDSEHVVRCLLASDTRRRLWARAAGRQGSRRGGASRRAGSSSEEVATVSTPLIEVRDLVKHFPIRKGIIFQKQVGAVQAVDGVSFDINEGETLGLVGESGCGKSTTARLITRLLEPTSGSIVYNGIDIANANRRALLPLRREMQMIFQDPYSSLNPRKTVGVDHRRAVRDPWHRARQGQAPAARCRT